MLDDDDMLDEDEDFSEIIRAKWKMDGANTLSEAAQMLRDEATRLEELEEEGWQLTGPVSDDYGYLEKN